MVEFAKITRGHWLNSQSELKLCPQTKVKQ